MKKNQDLLTPEEVAQRLRISRKTVLVIAREKRLPCLHIGRLVRFEAEAIDRWLERQR